MTSTQKEGTHRPTGQDPYLVTVPSTAAIAPVRLPLQGFLPAKASRHTVIGGGLPASLPLPRRQSPITSPEAASVPFSDWIRGGLNAIRGGVRVPPVSRSDSVGRRGGRRSPARHRRSLRPPGPRTGAGHARAWTPRDVAGAARGPVWSELLGGELFAEVVYDACGQPRDAKG